MKRYAVVRNDQLHHDRQRAPFGYNVDEMLRYRLHVGCCEDLRWSDGAHWWVQGDMGAIIEAPLADPGTPSNDDIPDDEWIVAENMWRGEP